MFCECLIQINSCKLVYYRSVCCNLQPNVPTYLPTSRKLIYILRGIYFLSFKVKMIVLISISVIFILILYKFLTRNFDYWKKKNVAYPTPLPLFGNFIDLATFKQSLGFVVRNIYDAFPDQPYVGAFLGKSPVLIIREPELLRLVMTKDFYYFYNRGLAADLEGEPLSANLFLSEGDKWRVLRQNMTPLFSSAKMKNMFHLMAICGNEFEKYIASQTLKTDEHDIRDLMSRFTMDVIGSCAFGLEMNSLSGKDTEFRKIGYRLFRPSIRRTVTAFVRLLTPRLYKLFGLHTVDSDINRFFLDLSRTVIEMREGRPAERHDLVDLLVQLKRQGHIDGDSIESMKSGAERRTVSLKLDDHVLAAQSFVFFGAGFETSSTTMSYALRELSLNKNILKRVHEEIDSLLVKYNGKITYDMVQEAKYLEKVVSETLRMYPLLTTIPRQCTSRYTFPDGLVVEPGIKVHIPVLGLHYDPKYYPNPEVFDPERFTPEAINERPQYAYMPFGEGQRLCIGMRFAKMQVAVGLVSLLKSYTVEPCARTEQKVTPEPKSIVNIPRHKIWLTIKQRY